MGFLDKILGALGGNGGGSQPPAASSSSPEGQPLQYPDELARDALVEYRNNRFSSALAGYANAIDKLHTMYVLTPQSQRIRQAPAYDKEIIDRFVASLGASRATGQDRTDAHAVRTASYLEQIADTLEPEGVDVRIYRDAIRGIDQSLRED